MVVPQCLSRLRNVEMRNGGSRLPFLQSVTWRPSADQGARRFWVWDWNVPDLHDVCSAHAIGNQTDIWTGCLFWLTFIILKHFLVAWLTAKGICWFCFAGYFFGSLIFRQSEDPPLGARTIDLGPSMNQASFSLIQLLNKSNRIFICFSVTIMTIMIKERKYKKNCFKSFWPEIHFNLQHIVYLTALDTRTWQ